MAKSASVSALLIHSVSARVAKPAATWLGQAAVEFVGAKLVDPAVRRAVQIRYSQVVRHVPRLPLALSTTEAAAIVGTRQRLDVSRWTLDQAARVALLGALPGRHAGALVTTIDQIAASADLHELIALYTALPLLAQPKRWVARAAEGVRSNMRAVFAAVALDNPYAAEELDDDAWNQLVLKAIFVGEPLYRIAGLDHRRNPELTMMLCDYAHERWAAKRPIPPGLWRCVGLLADSAAIKDLGRVLREGDEIERDAARLALASCAHPDAAALLVGQPVPTRDWAEIELANR